MKDGVITEKNHIFKGRFYETVFEYQMGLDLCIVASIILLQILYLIYLFHCLDSQILELV